MEKPSFIIQNYRQKEDPETGMMLDIGDVVWSDGNIQYGRVLSYCSRCGQLLRPGSINAGEGYHIDGCEGY